MSEYKFLQIDYNYPRYTLCNFDQILNKKV